MDLPVIGPVLKKIFGSANDRMVARYLRLAKQVSELESSVRPLTDAEIKAKTGEFRSRLADGASISDLTPEIFAVAREAMDRAVGIRAIFDPERSFDPSTLPEDVQSLYAETKAAMDAAEAMTPEGAFRGCGRRSPVGVMSTFPTSFTKPCGACTPNPNHLPLPSFRCANHRGHGSFRRQDRRNEDR